MAMKSPTRLYLASIAVFWGANLSYASVCFALERWLAMASIDADALFCVNVLCDCVALLMLVIAILRMARQCQSAAQIVLRLLLGAVTIAVNFIAFAVFAIWFHIAVMGGSL
jgi:hypothetical protein